MKFFHIFLAALMGMVLAAPQAVTDTLAPSAAAPPGCTGNADGTFEVTIVQLAKRDLIEKRSNCAGEGILVVNLKDGVLKDAQGRTGYIASNFQFQFDAPAQAGAIYTGGFSACGNGSLALGGSATFYQCLSGHFYNLYDRHWAAQCEPIHMNLQACGAGEQAGGQKFGGQVVGTTLVATTIVTVLSDGQPQVVPTVVPIPMCQIGDGQVQVHTTPCVDIPLPTATVPPASQTSGGNTPPATEGPAPPAPTGPSASAPANTPTPGQSTVSTPAPVPTTPGGGSSTPTPSAPPVAGARKFGPSLLVAMAVGLMGIFLYI